MQANAISGNGALEATAGCRRVQEDLDIHGRNRRPGRRRHAARANYYEITDQFGQTLVPDGGVSGSI